MNVDELRAQAEPFLVSKWDNKNTRKKYRGFITDFLDFLETGAYKEMTDRAIAEYMEPYRDKPNATTRENRVKEFRDYVRRQQKGEQQLSMFEETEPLKEAVENEVKPKDDDTSMHHIMSATDRDVKADTDREETSGTSMPYFMKAPRSSDADAVDMAKKEVESNSTVQETSTSKGKGRPKKAESDKRKNSFSVYLSESSAEALKDLARYDRKDVSVLLAEIIEMFISKNEDILTEYRTFYKNRRQLRQ